MLIHLILYINSFNAFSVTSDKFYVSVTPFIFKTEIVRKIISEIEGDFITWFHEKNVTEFFLYIAYLIKTQQLDLYYQTSDPYFLTFWKNSENFEDRKISEIHRKFLEYASEENMNKLLTIYSQTSFYKNIKDLINSYMNFAQ